MYSKLAKFASALVIIIFTLALCSVASYAAVDFAQPDVEKQITTTIKQIAADIPYFTVSGKACTGKTKGATWHLSCDNCFNGNVLQSDWFVKKYGKISISQIPETSRLYAKGWSCAGFSTVAEWLIFGNKSDPEQLKMNYVGKFDFNKGIVDVCKAGDCLRLDDKHSAIFISADSAGVTVLDANYDNCKGYCRVEVHQIPYSTKYKSVYVDRCASYDEILDARVALDPTTLTLVENQSYHLFEVGRDIHDPAFSSSVNTKFLKLVSTAPEVLSIENGVIMANKAGSAEILVMTNASDKVLDKVMVTVIGLPPTSERVFDVFKNNKDEIELMREPGSSTYANTWGAGTSSRYTVSGEADYVIISTVKKDGKTFALITGYNNYLRQWISGYAPVEATKTSTRKYNLKPTDVTNVKTKAKGSTLTISWDQSYLVKENVCTWDDVAYIVVFSGRSYLTTKTQMTFPNVSRFTTYTVEVRAINNGCQFAGIVKGATSNVTTKKINVW